jgi:hypothetical protein
VKAWKESQDEGLLRWVRDRGPKLRRIIPQDMADLGMHKKGKKPKFFMFHHFYPLINRFFENIRPKKIY